MTETDENNEKRFGEMLAEYRASRRMSLREFCRQSGADCSNISKIERGKMYPPKNRETIESYAEILGITDEKELQVFYHAACLENNIIPDDVNKKLMPAFFRTATKQKPTEEELEELIKLINDA